jgi:hypothetical protein
MYWIDKACLPGIYYDIPGKEASDKFGVQPICCTTYHYKVTVGGSAVLPLTEAKLQLCTDERTHDFTLALMDFAEWDDLGRPTYGRGSPERPPAAAKTSNSDSSSTSSGSGSVGSSSNTSGAPLISNESDSGKVSTAPAAAPTASAPSSTSSTMPTASGVAGLTTEPSSSSSSEYYLWPDFIYDLICRPREWASWRKRAERGIHGSRAERSASNKSRGSSVPVAAMTRREAYFEALCQDWLAELERLNAEEPS